MSAPAIGDRVAWVDDDSLGTVYDMLPSGSFGVRWDDGSAGWFHPSDYTESGNEDACVRKVQ